MTAIACGIDIGTTNLKVVLVDDAGRTIWTKAVPAPRIPCGPAEATDADQLFEAIESLVLEGWRIVGDGRPLKAIACAGVGEDGVGLAADLAPTGPALAWSDPRARAEAAELATHPEADARIGLAVGPDRTLAKWLWLARHDPSALGRAERGWAALTDYPAVRWTGRPFMSRSLAARTAAYDVFSRRWIEPLLAAAGAPTLPPVLDAGAVVGPVAAGRLLAAGAASRETLVVAGGHDHPVAADAIRRSDARARVDSLGTANLVYGEIEHAIAPRREPGLAFSVPIRLGTGDAPGVACLGVVEFAALLAATQEDARRLDACLRASGLPDAPLAADVPDADLFGRLAAVSLGARDAFRAMDRLGVAPGPIYATGGRSRSRVLMQLRASLYSAPVHVIHEPELVAVSAALIAAEGAGINLPFDAARRVDIIDPLPRWTDAYAGRTMADALPFPLLQR